ncbi:M10 family metallopeptidase C-terminal domain-containing protein [Aliiroseovarius sp. 2305UL8-7]|uniref:M10 family metallopeptidase C-terminal domain-containing protein n=1 Tax=Aliiroseovarius conchicola TaxID=3121637 RepID=UPI00352824F4
MALRSVTPTEFSLQLTHGFAEHHGAPKGAAFDVGSNRTLSYNVTGLSNAGKWFAEQAFGAWSAVTGITFVATSSASSDIRFSEADAGAYAYSRYNFSGEIIQSTVNISTAWIRGDENNLNSYSYQTYLHEIGHALGLGHAGDYNGSATFPQSAKFANDSWQMSVMSYFAQTENPYVNASFAYVLTPMAADIIAMNRLYGVPTGDDRVNIGNTVWGHNSNAEGPAGSFSSLQPAMTMTVYDQGGIDTLNFANTYSSQVIDIRAGHFSSVYGKVNNIYIDGSTLIENAIGGHGTDKLIGNNTANRLSGEGGNDVIYGGAGNDDLLGGAGKDVIYGETGKDTISGGAGWDIIRGGVGDDNVQGDDGNDALIGQEGHDLIQGGEGNDTIWGGTDNDTIIGGNGSDTLYGEHGLDTISGGTGWDIIRGGGGDDNIRGDFGNDALLGEQGHDFVQGGDGNDTIWGGADNDTITGGAGGDTLYGDHGLDTIFGGAGWDVIRGGGGNDDLNGDAGNDALLGDHGHDFLKGGDGNDTIWGGFDNDTIVGDAGGDTLYGDHGLDTIYGGAGWDIIRGGDGNDDLNGGEGNDALLGDHGHDFLKGGDGNDDIRGGFHNDTLVGGAGNDVMIGGPGRDTFIFSEGNDTIQDFSDAAGDTLKIEKSLVSTLDSASLIANNATSDGRNTTISFDSGDTLLLLGVSDPNVLVDDIFFI